MPRDPRDPPNHVLPGFPEDEPFPEIPTHVQQVVRGTSVESQPRMRRDQYQKLFRAQDGKCAICRQPETALDVDGTPLLLTVYFSTGNRQAGLPAILRGLLCRAHGTALMLMNDSPEYLARGIAFLTHEPPSRSTLRTAQILIRQAPPEPESYGAACGSGV